MLRSALPVLVPLHALKLSLLVPLQLGHGGASGLVVQAGALTVSHCCALLCVASPGSPACLKLC